MPPAGPMLASTPGARSPISRPSRHCAPEDLAHGMNALLPPAVRVRAAEEADPDFHARWCAEAKTYRYSIYRGRVLPPFLNALLPAPSLSIGFRRHERGRPLLRGPARLHHIRGLVRFRRKTTSTGTFFARFIVPK